MEIGGRPASFIVPVDAAGVTVLCRKTGDPRDNPFVSPLSSRFDELDGQMWLDEVLIPWERVFFVDPSPEAIPRWLRWHHLYGWLAKAEFTLGLALALTHAMGLKEHEQTIDYLVDLVITVQTVRSCLTAAERDPDFTPAGYCFPGHAHLAAGGHRAVASAGAHVGDPADRSRLVARRRARATATWRHPELAAGLEELFGGGGYTARSARRCCRWPGTTSPRRSTAANPRSKRMPAAGMPNWRGWLRRSFRDYNELANGGAGALDLAMPEIDLDNIRTAPIAARRVTAPPTGSKG